MKKKIIPIVCFLLTLVLCVAAYATVSSVRHREKNDTDRYFYDQRNKRNGNCDSDPALRRRQLVLRDLRV